jgi:hypothetical protein
MRTASASIQPSVPVHRLTPTTWRLPAGKLNTPMLFQRPPPLR